jgi:hypothetical protein
MLTLLKCSLNEPFGLLIGLSKAQQFLDYRLVELVYGIHSTGNRLIWPTAPRKQVNS